MIKSIHRLNHLIDRWLFIKKAKAHCIEFNYLFDKPNCAKWRGIYAGFLSDKENEILIELLSEDKIVKTDRVASYPTSREYKDFFTVPIYKVAK